jgi:nitrite reductase/ring-hydroxylating ferredoxin subunit
VTKRRLPVCQREDLRFGLVRTAHVGTDRYGLPREALVLLDAAGEVRAYVNQCKHLPIPIDSGSREFFDEAGTHLLCGTHGALFRLDDGMCIHGPCKGVPLDPIEVVEEEGEISLVVDDE